MKTTDSTPAAENFKGRGPLDAFLNLLSLITLSWLWIATIQVAQQIIDKFLSKPTINMYLSGGYSQMGLKFGIASMIIIAPVFFVVINILHKQYKKNKLNHKSGIHRWLTYLMILISSLVILGGLISLIYNLLNGAYTIAIILKILVTLISSALVFTFYFFDLRRQDYKEKSKLSVIFFAISVVAVVAIIIGGLFIVDSPQVTKMKQLDQLRVEDLSSINYYLLAQYSNTSKLPASLEEINIKAVDPETKQPYEYSTDGKKSYQLCATFSLVAEFEESVAQPVQVDEWVNHDAGRQCFTRDVTSIINLKDSERLMAPAAANPLYK